MSLELQRRREELVERTRAVADLSEEELRRFASEAARDRSEADLWALTEAHLTLHGSAGSRISKSTRSRYCGCLAKFLEAWAGESLLRPARNAGVLWIRELEVRYKPSTVRVHRAAAKALYAALRWSGATTAIPFADAKPVRDPTPSWGKRKAYSLFELDKLLHASKGATRLIVLLGAHAGLRVSEMVELAWEDVDLVEAQLVVREGKGGKRARVYLSGSLREALGETRPEERAGFVLPCRSRQSAYERLRTVCRRAKVPFRGAHALRHTTGTRMRHEPADLALVAEHLRHANLDTARGYAHADNRRLKRAVETW